MGLGVLDDKHMASPPGTAMISAQDPDVEMCANNSMSLLKRKGRIILQPQPSDDPNDPLNWPAVWKNGIMVLLAFSSAVTVSLGPMIMPGLFIITKQFKVSIDTASQFMVGLLAFWTGFATFFTASGASVWGKRPFFVISTAILLITCAWGYFATSFVSLAAMRVVQGIASAPLETLVTSTVSDLFFVHQRGKRLAIWTSMLASGFLGGQIISGFIIEKLGPLSTFGVSALFYCILLPLTYFVVFETAWKGPQGQSAESNGPEEKANVNTSTVEIGATTPSRMSYSQCLALFSGRVSSDPFWKGVIKPVPLIMYPAVLFSTFVHGIAFSALIVQGLLFNTVMTQAPYRLTPSQVGLTNIPHLVVSLLSGPLAGFLADFLAKTLSKRNSGIFEPEFRLLLQLVSIPITTASFIGTGYAIEAKAPLRVLLALGSLQAFSVPFASQAALTYVIDCHPRDANQAFVTINFVKAVMTFVASGSANGLMFKMGPKKLFNMLAGISLAINLLTVPAYIFGKRFRSWVARSKLAQKIA